MILGTIVTVTDLFKFLPVRKQLMSSSRRASEELKKVETVVKSLALIHPKLRVTLVHNKFMIWQKTSVSNLRLSVSQVVSQSIVKQLYYLHYNSELVRSFYYLYPNTLIYNTVYAKPTITREIYQFISYLSLS